MEYYHSVQFSRSVVSDSLRPHESQHTRPPCPSPTPRVHPKSCASSRWCHPAISSGMEWNITQPLKEWNNATCSNMDEPGDYLTKWNKLDRERQIPYMPNLKKWYKWIYLQNRNRLKDLENKPMVMRGVRKRDKLRAWDWHIHTHTHTHTHTHIYIYIYADIK